MSEEQVSVTPRRRSAEEAAQLVAEYEASQLSKREFCRRRGLAISTLDAYRSGRRLGLPNRKVFPAARWVGVEVSEAQPGRSDAAGSGLAVVLAPGRRIEVGRGFDRDTLRQLLGVLEQV
jgi:hypothetical protein